MGDSRQLRVTFGEEAANCRRETKVSARNITLVRKPRHNSCLPKGIDFSIGAFATAFRGQLSPA